MLRFDILLSAVLAVVGVFAPLSASSRPIHVGNGVDYAVPHNSPVKFVSLGQFDVASFKGRFSMSGTYHYGYITNDPRADATYGHLDLYFIPDKKIRDQLPYWQQAHRVREVRFRNERTFVQKVISASTIGRLKEKKILSASGRATILVDSYQASVECDYPTYSVRFVSIQGVRNTRFAMVPVKEYGC